MKGVTLPTPFHWKTVLFCQSFSPRFRLSQRSANLSGRTREYPLSIFAGLCGPIERLGPCQVLFSNRSPLFPCGVPGSTCPVRQDYCSRNQSFSRRLRKGILLHMGSVPLPRSFGSRETFLCNPWKGFSETRHLLTDRAVHQKRCESVLAGSVGIGFHMTFSLFLRSKITPCETQPSL